MKYHPHSLWNYEFTLYSPWFDIFLDVPYWWWSDSLAADDAEGTSFTYIYNDVYPFEWNESDPNRGFGWDISFYIKIERIE